MPGKMSGRIKGKVMENAVQFQESQVRDISIAVVRCNIPVTKSESRYLTTVESYLDRRGEALPEVLTIGLNVIYRRAKKAMKSANVN